MISCDYSIIRNEGDEEKEYKPDKYPTVLDNLAYIEGPNSSGKSTILHIIALSMYGLQKGDVNKDEKINKDLLDKMKYLVDPNHNKLNFKVQIANKDDSIQLISEKKVDERDITIYEIINGKKSLLTYNRFIKKYNLLYDIPQNPTKRLNELTKGISSIQAKYRKDIDILYNYFLRIKTEVENSKNPKAIEELKQTISASENECKLKEQDLAQKRIKLDKLEQYVYSKFYIDYYRECLSYQNSVDRLDRKIKTTKSNGAKKIPENLIIEIKEMSELQTRITNLLNKILDPPEINHLDIWKRININNALKNYEFEDNLEKETNYFRGILGKKLVEMSERKQLSEAKVYDELIKLLEQYKTTNITIPGVEKTIPEFIEILRKTNEENKESIYLYNNIDRTIELLNSINLKRKDINEKHLLRLKKEKIKSSSLNNSDNEAIKSEYNIAKKVLEDYTRKLKFYDTEISKKGLNKDDLDISLKVLESSDEIKPYRVYTEDQLLKAIKENSDIIKSLDNEINGPNGRKQFISYDKAQLKALESKPLHKYQDKLPEIQNIIGKCVTTQKKLEKYDIYINNIINKENNKIDLNNVEQKAYVDQVSKFLGNIIGDILYVDKKYKIKSIDVINEIILTDEGKKLSFNAISTGQGESAYFSGLLNSNDNRIIIALFDEIAMMDSRSLEPIFKKFRELYYQNKLLVGIVVRMSDKVAIKSLVSE